MKARQRLSQDFLSAFPVAHKDEMHIGGHLRVGGQQVINTLPLAQLAGVEKYRSGSGNP